MPECIVREELLIQYIDAGNRVVDLRKELRGLPSAASQQVAAALIDRALGKRIRACHELTRHCQEHGC